VHCSAVGPSLEEGGSAVPDQDLESTDIGPADLIHDIATEAQKDLEEAAAPQTEITADATGRIGLDRLIDATESDHADIQCPQHQTIHKILAVTAQIVKMIDAIGAIANTKSIKRTGSTRKIKRRRVKKAKGVNPALQT